MSCLLVSDEYNMEERVRLNIFSSLCSLCKLVLDKYIEMEERVRLNVFESSFSSLRSLWLRLSINEFTSSTRSTKLSQSSDGPICPLLSLSLMPSINGFISSLHVDVE